MLRSNRREFYECGFRPIHQKPIKIAMQSKAVAFLFIIYDTELIFSFPLLSTISYTSYTEVWFILFLYITLILSLVIDFKKLTTDWRV